MAKNKKMFGGKNTKALIMAAAGIFGIWYVWKSGFFSGFGGGRNNTPGNGTNYNGGTNYSGGGNSGGNGNGWTNIASDVWDTVKGQVPGFFTGNDSNSTLNSWQQQYANNLTSLAEQAKFLVSVAKAAKALGLSNASDLTYDQWLAAGRI